MSKRIVIGLLLAALLAASVPAAFAQARGAFSITCNVTGAKVYLNGELAGYTKPTFSALLKPGTYTVRVVMERYKPFETAVKMTSSPLNLAVKLVPESVVQQPGRFSLTVNTNVGGAQVFLNNAQAGVAPVTVQVEKGNYSVRVAAPGYEDFLASVSVAGNTVVNAVLQGRLLQLTVNCNVPGAQVYVNNDLAGTAPFSGSYAPGSYALRVTAPGYREARTTVNLNRNETVNLVLQGFLFQLTISSNVPGAQVYVNDVLSGTAPYSGLLAPGNYEVRATAPGFREARTSVDLDRDQTVNLVLQRGRQFQLTVSSNVPGAQVYVNNGLAGTTPYTGSYAPGSYALRVTAPGYREAAATVNLDRDQAVNLVLQRGRLYQLTVNSNVAGAQVYLNGELAGAIPFTGSYAQGSYEVRVRAPGYAEAGTVVNLNRNEIVNLILQRGRMFQLTVNCNVPGADVYVNDNLAGTAPFAGSFAQGSYEVRASAPGYEDAGTVVNLNRNEIVRLVLQPSLVSVQIVIPEGFLESRERDKSQQGRGELRLFVDGQRSSAFSFSVAPGVHNIRISSGGVSLDADFDFQPGRDYVLEPVFGWSER